MEGGEKGKGGVGGQGGHEGRKEQRQGGREGGRMGRIILRGKGEGREKGKGREGMKERGGEVLMGERRRRGRDSWGGEGGTEGGRRTIQRGWGVALSQPSVGLTKTECNHRRGPSLHLRAASCRRANAALFLE